MKKYFSRFFTLVLLISATILPLSCGIKDLYAGGTIKIKLPGNSYNSRESTQSTNETFGDAYNIHHFSIELAELDSVDIKVISSVNYDNLKPGSTVKISIKKAGSYILTLKAIQRADGKDFIIGKGIVETGNPDGAAEPSNLINIENGQNATIRVKFEAITPQDAHEIPENENGSINTPVTTPDELRAAINQIKTKDLPTRIYVDNIESAELVNLTITDKNVSICSSNLTTGSSLKNIAFTLKYNGKLKVENNISLENDVNTSLFTLESNGNLNLLAKNCIYSYTVGEALPAIKVSNPTKNILNIEGTEFKNYPGYVIEIGTVTFDSLKELTGKNTFKNIVFTNCKTEVNEDYLDSSIYNIYTGSDIHLSGDKNIIDSIYLDNNINDYQGWSNFSKIYVSKDFNSRHNTDENLSINPTSLYASNLRSIYNDTPKYVESIKKYLDIAKLVAVEDDTLTKEELRNLELNKKIDIYANSPQRLNYEGIVFRPVSSIITETTSFNSINDSLNICFSSTSTMMNSGSLGITLKNPATINNYANSQEVNKPVKIFNTYRYDGSFNYATLPAFNIERYDNEENHDYDVIFDGFDTRCNLETGEKSDQPGIVFKPSDPISGTIDPENNTLINVKKGYSRLYFGKILFNHAYVNDSDPTSGINFRGQKLTLDNVIFENKDNSGNKIGGNSLNIFGNGLSQQIVNLIGETKIDTIYIEPNSNNIIIDITDFTIPYDYDYAFTIKIDETKNLRDSQIIIAGANNDNLDKINLISDKYYIDNTGLIRNR